MNTVRFVVITCCILFSLDNSCFADDAIKIGVIAPLSGDFAPFGEVVRKAVEHERDSFVQFVFEDEQCDPKTGLSAYRKLSDVDRIKFFIGPSCGAPQKLVAPIAADRNQLLLLNTSASRGFFTLSKGKMFSVQYALEDESEFNAHAMFARGMRQVVIVHTENEYGAIHEQAFRKVFKGKILGALTYPEGDLTQLKVLALKVKRLAPDALYIPDAAPFLQGLMKELEKLGAHPKVYSIYPFQMSAIAALGKEVDGVFYSYPNIGEENAVGYFPAIAAKFLTEAIRSCRDDVACARAFLLSHHKFDEFGILSQEKALILKQLRAGRFTSAEWL